MPQLEVATSTGVLQLPCNCSSRQAEERLPLLLAILQVPRVLIDIASSSASEAEQVRASLSPHLTPLHSTPYNPVPCSSPVPAPCPVPSPQQAVGSPPPSALLPPRAPSPPPSLPQSPRARSGRTRLRWAGAARCSGGCAEHRHTASGRRRSCRGISRGRSWWRCASPSSTSSRSSQAITSSCTRTTWRWSGFSPTSSPGRRS